MKKEKPNTLIKRCGTCRYFEASKQPWCPSPGMGMCVYPRGEIVAPAAYADTVERRVPTMWDTDGHDCVTWDPCYAPGGATQGKGEKP